LYADDTVILGKSKKHVQTILHQIGNESARYGLYLNTNKCIHLNFAERGRIKHKSGDNVPQEGNAKYLGAGINKKGKTQKEVNTRIAETMMVWNKLHVYTRNTNCSNKQQMTVLEAIIRSRLVYGLETVQLTQAQISRINANQLKGIRKL
jgi:hypothetical protein